MIKFRLNDRHYPAITFHHAHIFPVVGMNFSSVHFGKNLFTVTVPWNAQGKAHYTTSCPRVKPIQSRAQRYLLSPSSFGVAFRALHPLSSSISGSSSGQCFFTFFSPIRPMSGICKKISPLSTEGILQSQFSAKMTSRHECEGSGNFIAFPRMFSRSSRGIRFSLSFIVKDYAHSDTFSARSANTCVRARVESAKFTIFRDFDNREVGVFWNERRTRQICSYQLF